MRKHIARLTPLIALIVPLIVPLIVSDSNDPSKKEVEGGVHG